MAITDDAVAAGLGCWKEGLGFVANFPKNCGDHVSLSRSVA